MNSLGLSEPVLFLVGIAFGFCCGFGIGRIWEIRSRIDKASKL